VGLTWYEATKYCDVQFARLPTEIEWEYATPGPESYLYPWGNDFDANFISPNETMLPVDSNPQGVSWFGVYNMVPFPRSSLS
jgi:gamma-glutamyl hercynylcysteine S-oxide synthase